MQVESLQTSFLVPEHVSVVHRWVTEKTGEAFLTGEFVRQIMRGSSAISVVAELVSSEVSESWVEPLQDLDCVQEAHYDGSGVIKIRLSELNGTPGARLELRAYRSALHLEGEDVAQGLIADLSNQALTIDACALNSRGELIDPFGGYTDLRDGCIRTIMNPDIAFREEPANLLYVASAIAELGMDADKNVSRYASRDAANVLSVPRAIWLEQINRLLVATRVDLGLQWLFRTRVLNFLLPEVSSLVGFHESCAVHHKDCWDHTLKVIRKSAPDLVIRWAALCHDIGKIWTRNVDRRGQVHFYRHEEFGAVLFEGVAARFRMGDELRERIYGVIALHGRVNLYVSDWSDSAVRRLIRDVHPHMKDLIKFSRADYTSKRQSRIDQIKRQLDELEARIGQIELLDAVKPSLPKGLGHSLINELEIKPGPILGQIRAGLEALCKNESLDANQDASYYVEAVQRIGVEEVCAAAV